MREVCPKCHGKGFVRGTCSHCNGTGIEWHPFYKEGDDTPCHICNGEGETDNCYCMNCYADGYIYDKDDIW